MNTFRKIQPAAVVGALSLFLLPATQGFGQTTATTDPVGYTALSLPANTDSLISIPFTRPAVFVGAIGSISTDTTSGLTTITTAASPGWTASQYKYAPTAATPQTNTYYAIIGPKLTTVPSTVSVTNGQTGVTAASAGAFTGIVAGDELIVNGLAYNIASVTSDTALVLSRAYTGTTLSGQTATYDHSPKEGSYYTVTDNGTNTLTFNPNGDTFNTMTSDMVPAGATVSLIPYWTLGTAFPDTDLNVSYIASGTAGRTFKTQILTPDLVTAGTDLAAKATYVYNASAWRIVGPNGVDTTTSYNNTILPPTNFFIVRNTSTGTTFTPTGGVVMNRVSTPLDTQSNSGQDNPVALPRPVNVTLNDLNLISSGAFTTTTGTRARDIKDTLLFYDNTKSGISKAADAVYLYYGGGWRVLGPNGIDTTTDYGNSVSIPYGTGFTIRKSFVTGAPTSFLQNTRTY